MSQPLYYPPQPSAPAPPAHNGLGTAGFVLGLVGLVLSPIPLVGAVAWPLVILGLIFSLIGVVRASKRRATNKGFAVAGVVLSAIGLLICVLWVAAFNKAVNDVNNEISRVATISYEVTGDAKNVTVTYTTVGDQVTTGQETAAGLPWTKNVDTRGYRKGGSLAVTTGSEGGTVTCKVVVDGKAAKTGTASGPFATATCSDF